ncbi:MAG: hypothetical protein ACP5DY_02795 [Thermovirgaceae bacterium]
MDVAETLPRVLREAPSADMYNEENGVVLLRDLRYRLRADGSMEKTVYLVVEEVRDLSKAWPSLQLTAPTGGTCEVLEAALYDRRTSRPVMSVEPAESLAENGKTIEIRIPNNLEGLILVSGYRVVSPTGMNIEDRVDLSMALPAWEQNIAVEVPAGVSLVSAGVGGVKPGLESGGPTDTYTWSFIDTPTKKTEGLFQKQSGTLVFSFREGARMAAEEARTGESAVSGVPVPKKISGFLAADSPVKAGESILGLFRRNGLVSPLLPPDLIRRAGDIPLEGPWSLWEGTFLLKNWMKKAGWNADILWEPAVELGKKVPATRKLWARPVLSLSPPSGQEFFFLVGQNLPAGSVPASLWGKVLYETEGGSLERRTVPAGEAGDHRLSVSWTLEMDDPGYASGELRLRARGGWLQALNGGEVPAGNSLPGFFEEFRFPNTPDINWGEPRLVERGTGFDMTVPFNTSVGIVAGGDILARWPVAVMPWQLDAVSENGNGMSLRHPLVYEQNAVIRLPEGYDVVALPNLRSSRNTGIVLTEEIEHDKRKQIVEGGYKIVATSAGTGEDGFGAFKSVTGRTLAWTDMTIPLRKKQ